MLNPRDQATETWQPIAGCAETYGVSTNGGVRSKRHRNSKHTVDWRLLKPTLGRCGYLQVSLCLRGVRTTRLVHHLVADAFLPPRGPTDTVVRHLNDDKLDNRVENLARGTYSDNMLDAIRNARTARGIDQGSAKLDDNKVREIRLLYPTGSVSQRDLAAYFGVSQEMICQIIHRRHWKHVV
jgi:hypothetical protein